MTNRHSPMNTLLNTQGCAASRLMHTITKEGPKSEITYSHRRFNGRGGEVKKRMKEGRKKGRKDRRTERRKER